MRFFGTIVRAVLMAATLVGCNGSSRSVIVTLPAADSPEPETPRSIDVHFYLDASGSMKGFLVTPKPGQKNYFKQTLAEAGDILSEAWPATVTFWRFGVGEPKEIPAEEFRRFSAFTDLSTEIDKAIGHNRHGGHESPPSPDRHQVKIIITDLWQSKEEEVGQLAKMLDDNYLGRESQAVGVLGVRSAFRGKVDLPGHPVDDAADSLPFYFLIGGQAPDVRFVVKHLVEDLKIDTPDHFALVFARRVSGPLTQTFSLAPGNTKMGITLDDRLVQGSADRKIPVLANVRHDLDLTVIGLPKRDGKSEMRIPMGTRVEVSATAFSKSQSGPDPRAKDAVNLDPDRKTMKIDRSRLRADTMYLFQVDFVGERQPLTNLDSWTLLPRDVDEVRQNKFPLDTSGHRAGRTLNLGHFLNVLSLKMFQYKIPIARYYFYVQAR